MRKGNLILVKHHDFISSIIRFITKSTYNHIGIFVDEENIVEAKMSGVAKTSLNYFKREKANGKLTYSVYEIKGITEAQVDVICYIILSELNSKYDFLQLLSLGFLFLIHKQKKTNPLDDNRRWICSELIADAAKTVGISFYDDIKTDSLSPGNIADSLITEKII